MQLKICIRGQSTELYQGSSMNMHLSSYIVLANIIDHDMDLDMDLVERWKLDYTRQIRWTWQVFVNTNKIVYFKAIQLPIQLGKVKRRRMSWLGNTNVYMLCISFLLVYHWTELFESLSQRPMSKMWIWSRNGPYPRGYVDMVHIRVSPKTIKCLRYGSENLFSPF